MEARKIVVSEEGAGSTVQRVLHDQGPFSHSEARGLVASGCVRRNGNLVARPDERCSAGDRLELTFERGRRYDAPKKPPKGDGYRIVYEDEDIVAAEKESGVITVPAAAKVGDSLLERLVAAYRKRGLRRPQVLAVHRIDRFTSGLVVFARTGTAYAKLREQFAQGRPRRVYLAFAEGELARESGRLVHYLAEHPKSLKVQAVPADRGAPRASCSYRVVERFAHATLVEVTLETGRRNQIRVQLAAEGHPLIGDVTYGRPTEMLGRTALHARELSFDHPCKPGRVRLVAELPRDLTRLRAELRRGASPRKEAKEPDITRPPARETAPGRKTSPARRRRAHSATRTRTPV
jgi:23S rRNA pseudouridine1911/1915/1917 synthase